MTQTATVVEPIQEITPEITFLGLLRDFDLRTAITVWVGAGRVLNLDEMEDTHNPGIAVFELYKANPQLRAGLENAVVEIVQYHALLEELGERYQKKIPSDTDDDSDGTPWNITKLESLLRHNINHRIQQRETDATIICRALVEEFVKKAKNWNWYDPKYFVYLYELIEKVVVYLNAAQCRGHIVNLCNNYADNLGHAQAIDESLMETTQVTRPPGGFDLPVQYYQLVKLFFKTMHEKSGQTFDDNSGIVNNAIMVAKVLKPKDGFGILASAVVGLHDAMEDFHHVCIFIRCWVDRIGKDNDLVNKYQQQLHDLKMEESALVFLKGLDLTYAQCKSLGEFVPKAQYPLAVFVHTFIGQRLIELVQSK